MKIIAGVVVLVLAGLATACSDGSPSRTPRLPTQPTAVAPTAPAPTPALTGLVADSALRPLAGARVEILDGPLAGTSAVTDSFGFFQFTGSIGAGTRARATSAGYVASEATVSCSLCSITFRLAPDRPSVDMSGQYTLIVAADPSCTALEGPLGSRSFSATVTRSAPADWPPETSFAVTVNGDGVLKDFNRFSIHTAGDYVTFFLEETDGPALIEQIAASEFLAFSGIARGSAGPPGTSSISAPFDGFIHRCSFPAQPFSWHGCDEAPGHNGCRSKNNRLTFTRR